MQTVGTAVEGAALPACARTPKPYVSFQYVCKFCFKTFKSGHALGGHQNRHRNDELREVGKYCGLTFGFENRRQRNAVATRQSTKRGRPRVADGSSPPALNQPAGGVGNVAQDSILAMARPRLNNQPPRPRPPVAPIMNLQPDSTGTETGPGAVYEPMLNKGPRPARQVRLCPTWGIRPRAGQTGAGAEAEYSTVEDKFSNPGFNRWSSLRINSSPSGGGVDENVDVTPPGVDRWAYHSYRRGGEVQPPVSWSDATVISESGSVEVSSQPENGVDLELKL